MGPLILSGVLALVWCLVGSQRAVDDVSLGEEQLWYGSASDSAPTTQLPTWHVTQEAHVCNAIEYSSILASYPCVADL